MGASVSSNSNENINNHFKTELDFLAKNITSLGISVNAYNSGALKDFSKLPEASKIQTLNNLKVYNEICIETMENGNRLDDSKKLTWFALQKLNFSFRSDIFDKMSDDDIIEVYNKDNLQVFRNFKFFDLCSYTLEEIFCRPWTDLFHRADHDKFQSTLNYIFNFYNLKNLNTVCLKHLGSHKVVEIDQPNKSSFDFVIKNLSPVFDSDKAPCGFIAIENIQQDDSLEFTEPPIDNVIPFTRQI